MLSINLCFKSLVVLYWHSSRYIYLFLEILLFVSASHVMLCISYAAFQICVVSTGS